MRDFLRHLAVYLGLRERPALPADQEAPFLARRLTLAATIGVLAALAVASVV